MARRTFAVIGLGRFGSAIATTLTELGQEVIGIDGDEEKVRALADIIHQAIELDATDERALRAAGMPDVDVAVVSIGENIEASLLVVMLVKELGVQNDLREGGDAAARAHPDEAGRDARDLSGTRDGRPASRTAWSCRTLLDYVELSRDFSIIELPAPADWAGRSLRDLALRARFGLTLIAIERPGRDLRRRDHERRPLPQRRSSSRTTSSPSSARTITSRSWIGSSEEAEERLTAQGPGLRPASGGGRIGQGWGLTAKGKGSKPRPL